MKKMKITDILYEKDFTFSLGTFLDDFKRSDNKMEMIWDEPLSEKFDKEKVSILAAVAHKLANDYKLNPPQWVNKDSYYLPYPIFSFNTSNKEYQEYLRDNTPFEFASRNIFYGNNAIERV